MTNRINNVLKNSIYYLIERTAAPLITFITIPIYTRLLTSSEYGDFVIIITTINFLVMIGPSAVNISVLRFYKRYHLNNEESDFVNTVFIIFLMSIFVGAIIAFFLIVNLKSVFEITEISLIILMLLIFILDSHFKSLLNLVRTIEYAKLYFTLSVLHSVVRTSLGIILFFLFYQSIQDFLTGWLIAGAIFSCIIAYKMRMHITIDPKRFSRPIARSVCSYGMPFLITGLGILAMDQIDRYMILYFRGSTEIAIYNAGYLISSNSIYILSSFLMMAAFPAIVTVWEKEGRSATKELISKLLRIFFLICLPASVGVSILSKEILSIILPADYITGYTIVPWIAFGAFITGLLQYYTKSFILLGKTVYNAGLYVFGAAINFILNVILIPEYGFWGAGLSTTLSYSFIVIILIILNKSVFNLHWTLPKRSLFNIIIASLIMGIVVYYFKNFFKEPTGLWSLTVIIILGIITYLIFLKILKEINHNEITTIRKLILSFIHTHKSLI